ncbi:MAG: cytochrome c biogenesis protein ResB, partial [bacterium]
VEAAPSATLNLASVFDVLRGRRQSKLADCDPNRAWLFHGTQFDFDTPQGLVRVGYEGRSIPLDFAIHLDDFREETYPGVALAASFESHVVVKPDAGPEFPVRIYMNHPLKLSGYTFYQASFQRTPEGGEITVLSVARDPGMRVSFVGYCILVAGLLLIFFVKPWFVRLDDRFARRKVVAKEGVAA